MSSEPTPEQIERGRKITNWALGFAYWLAVAPTLFTAGYRVAVIPFAIVFETMGLPEGAQPFVGVALVILGVAAGVSLVWVVWRQARSYFAKRAAA